MNVLTTIIRLLTFKLTKEEILQFDYRHFIAGLTGTWIVGMGRYWDDKEANLFQHLGLGSVIYIFMLAGFIWLIITPFFVNNWKYFTVLTFISLTSFPAILYSIPVEKFFSIGIANTTNGWFLAIVAIWRLCLLFYFLRRFTGLSKNYIFTATLMPVCLIISTLTALNLHHVVFDLMSGVRNPSPHDSSYFILMLLTFISAILTLPLLTAYAIGISKRYREKRSKKK